jgi:BMFP domain-containing protein YqiC
MTQTSNRILDEFAKLMTDAAGVAQGVRREVETAFRGQAERILGQLEVVQREEFEAVRAMAAKAREQNEALARRVEILEAQIAAGTGPGARQADAGVPPKSHIEGSAAASSDEGDRSPGP